MFPKMCYVDETVMDEKTGSLGRASTISAEKGMDDKIILLVREEVAQFMENNFPSNRAEIRDVIVIQDRNLVEITDITFRIDLMALTSLYIVDCNLNLDEDSEVFNSLPLQTLVLSKNKITALPPGIFSLEYLEVLIVNENCIQYIPTQIANLTNLRVFSCDKQCPKLKSLPHSLSRLVNLQVLSFNDNKVEHISWITAMRGLRILSCRNNTITKLPELSVLEDLRVLDISQNLITHIPLTMHSIIDRLIKFDYYCRSLRPRFLQQGIDQLTAHLGLQHLLLDTPNKKDIVKDVNVVFVGEKHSGKTSLIEALSDQKSICKDDIKHEHQFNMRHFQLPENGHSFLATTFNCAGEFLDPYLMNYPLADVYVLTMNVSRLDLNAESLHKAIRHIQRMQLWLQMLYEISPETPVIIAGTHADSIKTTHSRDIWRFLKVGLFDSLHQQHAHSYKGAYLKNCLLCNHEIAIRRHHVKSKSETGGIVDVELLTTELKESADNVPQAGHTHNAKINCPHIVGYYEVDSKKTIPKELKKVNWTMECLRTAIARTAGQTCSQSIPSEWLNFVKHVISINEERPDIPCMPVDELESIAKRLNIKMDHFPFVLQYFHERGKILHFKGSKTLEQIAIIKPDWFIQRVHKFLGCSERSVYDHEELLEMLADEELDKLLFAKGSIDTPTSNWMLSAFEQLEICIPITGSSEYVVPLLLEMGDPPLEAWPESPDWEEKQVVYELPIDLASLEPGLFGMFCMQALTYDKEYLKIITDPEPIILNSHFVFFTELDRGLCYDCLGCHESVSNDDIIQRVHIQLMPNLSSFQITVRGPRPCCIVKIMTEYVEKQFIVHMIVPSTNSCPPSSTSTRKDTSTQKLADSSKHQSESDTDTYSILCPKCVLLRTPYPDKFRRLDVINKKRKAICKRWHNLGSWSRAFTGDYHISTPPGPNLASMLDSSGPRLFMVLPPTISTSIKEWLLYAKTNFMEDFELHILCECPSGWHFAGNNGFRLSRPRGFEERVGNLYSNIVNSSLPIVQVINGIQDFPQNGPIISEVACDLIKSFEYFRSIDPGIADPIVWLRKNRNKVISYLSNVITNATDKIPDLYFKVANGAGAESLFQGPPPVTKQALARYLRVDCDGGRFGTLRPLKIYGQVRWLCDMHYEEMRLNT